MLIVTAFDVTVVLFDLLPFALRIKSFILMILKNNNFIFHKLIKIEFEI